MNNNRYFVVSIDTEADCSPTWAASDPLTFRNITWGLPNLLQPLFEKLGVVPTYLLTVEVLQNPECVEVLKKIKGKAELGTHLHGELMEPEKTFFNYNGMRPDDFSCFYDEEIEFKKLKGLTDLFYQKLSQYPTSFRAGRFGAGPSTLRSLEKLKYRADSSVTPYTMWKNRQGVLDFRRAPIQPYFPDTQRTIARAGSSQLIEVPVSIIKKFLGHPIWLRPHKTRVEDMVLVLDTLESKARGASVFANMMFHSMEIIPQASPYPQTEQEVRQYLSDMESVFVEAARRGYQFIGLSEVRNHV